MSRTGEDVVRDVVAELAPDEVPQLESMFEAYRRRPWPAVPRQGRGHPTGAGLPPDQLASWGFFAAGFVGNALLENGVRRWFRQPRLTAAVPGAISEEKVRSAAYAAARQRGFPDGAAAMFADAVTRHLRG